MIVTDIQEQSELPSYPSEFSPVHVFSKTSLNMCMHMPEPEIPKATQLKITRSTPQIDVEIMSRLWLTEFKLLT